MALCVLKWFLLTPVSFAITLVPWVIAPLAVLLANSDGYLPKWLRWASTASTNLDGDSYNRSRWKSQYIRRVWWMWRNPGVVAQSTPPLGFVVEAGDAYGFEGDEETADNNGGHSGKVLRWIERDGKVGAFQFYLVHQYSWHKTRCLRVCLGWKLWRAPAVGKTCQHTARIAVFKHFGQGKG